MINLLEINAFVVPERIRVYLVLVDREEIDATAVNILQFMKVN